jgi:hypothetical protein
VRRKRWRVKEKNTMRRREGGTDNERITKERRIRRSGKNNREIK